MRNKLIELFDICIILANWVEVMYEKSFGFNVTFKIIRERIKREGERDRDSG